MAYNRCIGTRYCANNCPYKVRRFNFFDYNQRPITPQERRTVHRGHSLYLGPLTEKASPDTIKMQKNPNVTVRMRGVMEKCTFCVQRIEEAKIATKVKAGRVRQRQDPGRRVPSGLPAGLPGRGDRLRRHHRSRRARSRSCERSPRGYRLLEYLNISPRVIYLAQASQSEPAHARRGEDRRHSDERIATRGASPTEPNGAQSVTPPEGHSNAILRSTHRLAVTKIAAGRQRAEHGLDDREGLDASSRRGRRSGGGSRS